MNKLGFTLIEVFIGLAVASVGMLAMGTLIGSAGLHQRGSGLTSCLSSVRIYYLALLNRDPVWQTTLNDGDNKAGPFSCFQGNPPWLTCPTGKIGPFKVVGYKPTGAPPTIFDPINNASPGFTKDCQPCLNSPSAQCPIQLDLKIKVMGDASRPPVGYYSSGRDAAYSPYANTASGQIIVYGSFNIDPAFTPPVANVDQYGFEIARPAL